MYNHCAPTKACFPRQARLRTAADYRRVFDRPFRSTDVYLTILARRNELEWPRLGFAISKKQVARAAARNRIKRLLRESFRLKQRELPSVDLVVLARTGLGQRSNREIHRSLERHWKKLIDQCRDH